RCPTSWSAAPPRSPATIRGASRRRSAHMDATCDAAAAPHYNVAMALMNLDAGEHDDEPEELWANFDLLNIACGGHAGDAASMERVVGWCVASGRTIGAHPAYPDRANFGRRTMAIEPEALGDAVREQCAALAAIARRHKRPVTHVKPHGALYHDAAADPALARAVVAA